MNYRSQLIILQIIFLTTLSFPSVLRGQQPTPERITSDCVELVKFCITACSQNTQGPDFVRCVNEARQLHRDCTHAPKSGGWDPGSATEGTAEEEFEQILTYLGLTGDYSMISVYPNPVSSDLTISYVGWSWPGELLLTIRDGAGNSMVHTSRSLAAEQGGTWTLPLALSPGVYFAELVFRDEIYFFRLQVI